MALLTPLINLSSSASTSPHLYLQSSSSATSFCRWKLGVVGVIGYGGEEGEGGDNRGGHSRPGGGTGFTKPPAGRRWRSWKPATASVAAFAMPVLRRQGRARCRLDPRRRRQPGALNRREAGPLDLPEPWERICGFPAYAVAVTVAEGGLFVYQATFDSVTALYLPLMDAAKAGGGGDESLQPELRLRREERRRVSAAGAGAALKVGSWGRPARGEQGGGGGGGVLYALERGEDVPLRRRPLRARPGGGGGE